MATITINIDPMFHVGPLMLTWHGLMIAVGIVAGGWLATRYAEELELSRDTVFNLIALLALAGIVGSHLLYLILNDAAALLRPDQWLGSRGFAFYGTTLLWATVAAYSAGRFVMFFWRSDTAGFASGLNVAQVTSLGLLAVALIGLWWARRSRPAGEPLAAAA